MESFSDSNISIVAASTGSREDAQDMADRHSLGITIGYGLDHIAVSSATGCFYESDQKYLQPAGFILNPEGVIINAVYSTGPVGRFVAKDCLGKIKFEMG